jgi:hypothetical protein
MRLRMLSFLAVLALCCGASPAVMAQVCEPGLTFHFDWLHLQPRRSPTPYAGTLVPAAPDNDDDVSFSQETILHETNYSDDDGFRFGIGWLTADCWDVSFDYTNFTGDGASAVNPDGIGSDNVFANFLDREMADDGLDEDFDDGVVDFAQEDLSLQYDLYDLSIGRFYRPTGGLTMRAFGGLRGAEIRQDSAIQYRDFDGDDDLASIVRTIDMDGVGLRFGGQAIWNVIGGLSVSGRAATSFVYGDFNVTRTERQVDPDDAEIDTWRYYYEHQKVVPALELALGVRWDHGPFFVGFGYEVTHWFGLYQDLDIPGYGADDDDDSDMDTVPIRSDRGDLTLDGWYAEGGFIW